MNANPTLPALDSTRRWDRVLQVLHKALSQSRDRLLKGVTAEGNADQDGNTSPMQEILTSLYTSEELDIFAQDGSSSLYQLVDDILSTTNEQVMEEFKEYGLTPGGLRDQLIRLETASYAAQAREHALQQQEKNDHDTTKAALEQARLGGGDALQLMRQQQYAVLLEQKQQLQKELEELQQSCAQIEDDIRSLKVTSRPMSAPDGDGVGDAALENGHDSAKDPFQLLATTDQHLAHVANLLVDRTNHGNHVETSANDGEKVGDGK
jgi:hypothetical protein